MDLDPQASAVVGGDHGDPFGYLGAHEMPGGEFVVRGFLPGAREVRLIDHANDEYRGELAQISDTGLFQIRLTGPPPYRYRFRVTWEHGTADMVDPYQFGPWLSDADIYLFREGTHLALYERLGAHLTALDGIEGVAFAVWAPNAVRVSLVGEFNRWDGRRHPMRLHPGAGIWEIFIPGMVEGAPYKYEIKTANGRLLPLKADPFAFKAELPPGNASIVYGPGKNSWADSGWLENRARNNPYAKPMLIYEVHLGSWRRNKEGGYLTYLELARTLVPYAKDLGFTHIELLPIFEHPFDGSWGYQPTGLFAATSRFGQPEDLACFVDTCHQAGLGVILDWVPGHFPNDPHGLGEFDGTKLYEHADPRLGLHKDWNTLIYNYGRVEAAEFLINSAIFWLDRYHVDGLRVDAVASMLYLDYSRASGEWIPNRYGGNQNLDAIDFLKRLNETVYARFPGAITIAEESTAWPLVSRPIYDGGLGFGFKWNMGWMHDTLVYMALDPIARSYHQEKLTFGMLYAFSENFVLPLSHDEVVHGKRSILGRMSGDPWQRFANLRVYYTFMYAHPGKKLLFMGNEFAQENEWNHDRSLDWHLLAEPRHQGVHRLVRDLNLLVRQWKPLHERDHDRAGFDWIDASDRGASVLAFVRYGDDAADHLIAVVNFTPVVRHNYRIGVPGGGYYREIFNSDEMHYGGSGVANPEPVLAEALPWQGRSHSIALTLPPLAGVFLVPVYD